MNLQQTLNIQRYSLLGLLLFIASCGSRSQKVTTELTSPNIILVLTDDQGYGDISSHGSPDVLTPNMDKLKSQGISLDDFQVSPTCAPTRSAIMTGKHPFKNGITHTILERERMALGIITLPEILKKGNYTTGIFGKWHLGDETEYQPQNRGFDEVFIHGGGGIGQAYPGSCADVPDNKYFDPTIKHNGTFVKTKGFCTDIFFAQALSWIKKKSKEDKPFFAYIPTNAPHGPFIAPESYKKKYIEQGYPPNAQGFYAMIENIDDNLGSLMKKLDTWGIADNTILIFMSDNGKTWGGQNKVHGEITYNAGMKGFKGGVHEGGTRVPFFIRWPKKFAEGKKIDVLLNHYDILPTLTDIVGINISDVPDLDGQSFLPLLIGEDFEHRDRYRFVHRGRWPLNPKHISNLGNIDRQNIKNSQFIGKDEKQSDPENSKYKGFAVRSEQYRFVDNNELYDVIKDPGQKVNIASEHPEVVAQMQKVYNEWWNSIKSFLVNESVPLAKEKPYWVEYYKQEKSTGIPEWTKPNLD
ncbi:arylsulfatase [Tamlana sp. 2201CG12-4]|uniref:arylsulfatase n=1 Tax=Tamlana sp. 2201CG12-4 TaxID=3112582 RepID=UPI002DB5E1BA|nr:arylsulfatase [Tamlana sp. 2201CG12-4]MEC3908484.1 arylsulfatase [Tamlana sp. 2201CG12-4]